MKIYIDILLITNGIMTCVYLEALCRICHRTIKPFKLFAACAVGGLSSLIIVIDGSSYFQSVGIIILKLAGIVLTLCTAFRFRSFYEWLRYFMIYCTVSALFTGVTVTVWQLSRSRIIFFKNLTVYFNVSILNLVLATATAYGLLSLYEIITRKSFNKAAKYEAIYENGGYILKIPAVCDSGNRLCDTFTGTPIVVFCCDELYFHYDLDSENPETLCGFRLIPYNTVSGEGLIHVTANGKVRIIDDRDNCKEVKCYVGVIRSQNGTSRAIFNPVLIS